ncbi:MAG: DUF1573 domain-containing protein [Planctomycetaceae bacterium]
MNAPRQTAPVDRGNLRLLLVAVALLPFGWGIGQQFVGSEPAVVRAAVDRPGLTFQQYMVDLGRVRATPIVGARFGFKNTGKHAVKIVAAKPSCGCLKPRIKKTEFAPGETGELILPVETPNQTPGPKEYRLTVRYTDPKPRETTLVFRVTLPEKQVLVEPRALVMYQLGTKSTTRLLAVIDLPKTGLKLTGVSCKSKLATVKLDKTVTDEFGHNRHLVSVTVAGNVPPGRHNTTIVITTDNATYPRIRVPLMLFGPVPRTAASKQSSRK